MTTTEQVIPTRTIEPYRDIHKGIRAVLFSVTSEAGRIDPADCEARAVLGAQVDSAAELLEGHAGHEDRFIQPVLEEHAPALAEHIAEAHASLAARVTAFRAEAGALVAASPGEERPGLYQLYLDLALFTASYLEHQEMEERVVTPALVAAIGADEVLRLDEALAANIPPDVMATGLAVMMPAMNIDDRAEMLGGMRVGAPPQVFEGAWALVRSVLETDDALALAGRLGL